MFHRNERPKGAPMQWRIVPAAAVHVQLLLCQLCTAHPSSDEPETLPDQLAAVLGTGGLM